MSPETIQLIDGIDVTLNAGGMNTINIVLAFVMYGVALGIKPGTFVQVFVKPKSLILGMTCQLVLLPLFTFLLTLVFGTSISWTMALGMILVSCCPGGNISNFMSSLSKANVELSVSLTAVSTALAILMTPFNFWLYGNLCGKLETFRKFCDQHSLDPSEVAYFGDDIADTQVMRVCGFAIAPADACEEARAVADYVTRAPGGKGCIREGIELILKAQDNWHFDENRYDLLY